MLGLTVLPELSKPYRQDLVGLGKSWAAARLWGSIASMPFHHLEGGWLELIVGPMFSGKSEELIRRVTRALIAKQQVQVFKPAIDKRYDSQAVASHAGRSLRAIPVDDADCLRAQLHPQSRVVAIDEGQFFGEALIAIARDCADTGQRVIIAGLDLDFRGEPFGVIPDLLARAEFVDKLSAICARCGAPATRTQRLIAGQPAHYHDPIILVAAAEHYEPRCRHCHRVLHNERPQSLNLSEDKRRAS